MKKILILLIGLLSLSSILNGEIIINGGDYYKHFFFGEDNKSIVLFNVKESNEKLEILNKIINIQTGKIKINKKVINKKELNNNKTYGYLEDEKKIYILNTKDNLRFYNIETLDENKRIENSIKLPKQKLLSKNGELLVCYEENYLIILNLITMKESKIFFLNDENKKREKEYKKELKEYNMIRKVLLTENNKTLIIIGATVVPGTEFDEEKSKIEIIDLEKKNRKLIELEKDETFEFLDTAYDFFYKEKYIGVVTFNLFDRSNTNLKVLDIESYKKIKTIKLESLMWNIFDNGNKLIYLEIKHKINKLKILDAKTFKEIKRFDVKGEFVHDVLQRSIEISPNETMAAIADSNNNIHIFDLKTDN